jgi:hypothetical protein
MFVNCWDTKVASTGSLMPAPVRSRGICRYFRRSIVVGKKCTIDFGPRSRLSSVRVPVTSRVAVRRLHRILEGDRSTGMRIC